MTSHARFNTNDSAAQTKTPSRIGFTMRFGQRQALALGFSPARIAFKPWPRSGLDAVRYFFGPGPDAENLFHGKNGHDPAPGVLGVGNVQYRRRDGLRLVPLGIDFYLHLIHQPVRRKEIGVRTIALRPCNGESAHA